VYFNADTLMLLYDDLKEKALAHLDDYEIIMIDDGSRDESWSEMKKIKEIDQNVNLIKLSRNFGSHAATFAGLSACTGDCATIKAADLQEPSELILQMYDSWKSGNKVVLAVREDREDAFSQKVFANLYYWLVQKFALKAMPIEGFDCYLIDRKVVEILKLLDEKNSALTLQILWAGFQTNSVYYTRKKREVGTSKWTFSKKIKLVVDSLVSFSFLPIRCMSVAGMIFFVIAVVWGIVLIINRILGDIPVQGWTTMMVLLLFSSGLIMLTLGILGEYVWRALDASRKRPVYIVDEYAISKKGNCIGTDEQKR
jgi:dolichol-phosphate mannosyltransferase